MARRTGNPNAKSKRRWSKLAERGLQKYSSLRTSKAMRAYRAKFVKAGHQGKGDEKFYEFVARTRLRRRNSLVMTQAALLG